MSQFKVFSDKSPSDMFEGMVCNSGSPVNDCEHCGRVHFDSTGEHMEPGELAVLQRRAESEPEKYIPHSGTVHWGRIFGKDVVIGCQCNFLGWIEPLIWHERHLISRYLIQKSKAVLEEAQRDMDSASGTSVVDKT